MIKTPTHRGGFTVPEMLAIVAIIMILIALLMPTYHQMRRVAQKAICASNLHQQGVAMRAYVTESNFYPGHCGMGSNGRVVAIWPTRMRKFAPSRDVFNCPTAPAGFHWRGIYNTGANYAKQADVDQWDYELGELLLDVHLVPFTYGYNDWGRWNVLKSPQRGLGGDIRWGGLAVNEVAKHKVAAPSNMLAVTGNTNDGSWDYNVDPTNPIEYPGKLHFDGDNVLFSDAHVEWFLQSDLVNVNLGTQAGIDMSRKWNNHNKETSDQN